MPNLASRAMGLALRHLPDHWQEKHGYRPLLAETFTDIENDGDFFFQLKGKQPTALTEAHRIAVAGSPFLTAKRKIADTVG